MSRWALLAGGYPERGGVVEGDEDRWLAMSTEEGDANRKREK